VQGFFYLGFFGGQFVVVGFIFCTAYKKMVCHCFSMKYRSLLLQLWSFNRWRILNLHIYLGIFQSVKGLIATEQDTKS